MYGYIYDDFDSILMMIFDNSIFDDIHDTSTHGTSTHGTSTPRASSSLCL